MATKIYSNNEVTIYRAEHCDTNGNPRHIVHFLDFLTKEEIEKNDVIQGYTLALQKAKRFGYGWRKFHNREFCGGLICQGDYINGIETAKKVIAIRNSETI